MNSREALWAGRFGDEYTDRNRNGIASNIALFSRILSRTQGVESVLEIGANIGLNLAAIHNLIPDAKMSAVEINAHAATEIPSYVHVHITTLLNFDGPEQWDMTLSKGVLIHVAPDDLPSAYATLYNASRRYIVLAEYYNPSPMEIPYRGEAGALWKRDFAGEMLTAYPDLSVVDYGFAWKRDPVWPQDDLNWWILSKEKR